MRIFVVVAKTRPDLYPYFSCGFAGVGEIEVILDRRIGPDNPQSVTAASAEGNRRVARNIYDELEHRGFVIVRLPGESDRRG